VQATTVPNFSLITAGACDAEAIHQLSGNLVQKSLEQLKAEYEFIVIDSAPVLPVADSLLIAEHVDGVLFSVLRDVSRLPKVYAAYQRLGMLGVPVLGAVVNGVREDHGGYGYSYRTHDHSGSTAPV